MNTIDLEFDIVVIGGGTAGPMAAIKANEGVTYRYPFTLRLIK